jgi:hypothetical protein
LLFRFESHCLRHWSVVERKALNMTIEQPTNQPRTLECSGSELAGLLADLKARGCIVLGMASICVSRWRLSLAWPDQPGAGPSTSVLRTGDQARVVELDSNKTIDSGSK